MAKLKPGSFLKFSSIDDVYFLYENWKIKIVDNETLSSLLTSMRRGNAPTDVTFITSLGKKLRRQSLQWQYTDSALLLTSEGTPNDFKEHILKCFQYVSNVEIDIPESWVVEVAESATVAKLQDAKVYIYKSANGKIDFKYAKAKNWSVLLESLQLDAAQLKAQESLTDLKRIRDVKGNFTR